MSETLDRPEMADDAAAAPNSVSPVQLELVLEAHEAATLSRIPAVAALRAGRPRISAHRVVWHDTAAGSLARQGLALAEVRGASNAIVWRLERARPLAGAAAWVPGTPAPILAEAASAEDALAAIGWAGEPLIATASFDGEMRSLPLRDGAAVTRLRLRTGVLRTLTAERPSCCVLLEGAPRDVFALAHAVTEATHLALPRASLADQARALATATEPRPRHLGAPTLPEHAGPAQAFACLVAQLTDVLLHWAPLAGADRGPEPVHQMRVALRRLRSALKLFRQLVDPALLQSVTDDLRSLGQVLGAARDWDVFVSGLGAEIACALSDEPSIGRMLTAAERQRRASYDTLRDRLEGSSFRHTGLRLAELALAELRQDAEPDLVAFARSILARRLRHVTSAAENLSDRPPAELHALRIQCKRLRYAAEFFAPLFAGGHARRYLRRLADVQERLGHVNDGAVAGALMHQLGDRHRGFAAGAVRGYVAARTQGAREDALRSWNRFRECPRFWRKHGHGHAPMEHASVEHASVEHASVEQARVVAPAMASADQTEP